MTLCAVIAKLLSRTEAPPSWLKEEKTALPIEELIDTFIAW
jgi:hypothetical protein